MTQSLFKYINIPVNDKIKYNTFHDFKLPNKIEFPFDYTHDLCHILQFKRNQKNRWDKGYLLFSHDKGGVSISPKNITPTGPSKTLKPFKTELEVNVINYLYFNNHHNILEDNYFTFKFGNKDSSKLILYAVKKYKKRIIKKRLQFINLHYKNLGLI